MKYCERRMIERGQVYIHLIRYKWPFTDLTKQSVACMPDQEDNIASETAFLVIVLGTDLINGDNFTGLWLYTTAYIRAMQKRNIARVSNKKQYLAPPLLHTTAHNQHRLKDMTQKIGLYSDGILLSNNIAEIPVQSIRSKFSSSSLDWHLHTHTYHRCNHDNRIPHKVHI